MYAVCMLHSSSCYKISTVTAPCYGKRGVWLLTYIRSTQLLDPNQRMGDIQISKPEAAEHV